MFILAFVWVVARKWVLLYGGVFQGHFSPNCWRNTNYFDKFYLQIAYG